ncbi:MAG: murein biosynthesis integral membrane protein MurJ [Rickettsiales bacterium]|jgi:putative peptidoglycan lipid II flippase|nr:murein biosynthesis integral membrane protein MurJ [Rickettsiales bacterium]
MNKFLKAVFETSFGTFMSRISGYLRDIFIAKYIGSGLYSDVFFMAFKIPNFFRKITAEGALSSAFVPIFVNGLTMHGQKKMFAFARNIFSILFYSLIVFTIFAEIFMPQLMTLFAPGYDGEKMQFVILLTKITFPYLIFISLVALMSGILNSYNKFLVTSLCPVILNLSLIFFAVVSKNLSQGKIVLFLSFGVLFSGLFQLLYMIFFVVKMKLLLFPVIPHWSTQTKQFFGKFWHTFLASGIVQINSFISSVVATLIPGAVSMLYYSDRVTQFPLSLIGTTIGVSILPHLSKALGKSGDNAEAQQLQESSFFLSLFFGLPSAIGLYMLAQPIVALLFERGQFTTIDTVNVATIIQIYSLSVPFYIFSKILNAIFYAKKDTKTPMRISLINLMINVILSVLLVRDYETNGIAFAGVVATIISTILLFYALCRDSLFLMTEQFKLKVLKTIYASIIMGVTILCIRIAIEKLLWGDIWQLLIAGGMGGCMFLFLSQAMGIVNLFELVDLFRRK